MKHNYTDGVMTGGCCEYDQVTGYILRYTDAEGNSVNSQVSNDVPGIGIHPILVAKSIGTMESITRDLTVDARLLYSD